MSEQVFFSNLLETDMFKNAIMLNVQYIPPYTFEVVYKKWKQYKSLIFIIIVMRKFYYRNCVQYVDPEMSAWKVIKTNNLHKKKKKKKSLSYRKKI